MAFGVQQRQSLITAAKNKEPLVLESPWNSDTITDLFYLHIRESYHTHLYALHLNTVDQSWLRVAQRNDLINRRLDKEMVKSTFYLNFKNLIAHYTSFDKTYLINSAADENGLKVAFAKNKLSYLKSNDDTFLTAFREVAAERGYLNSEAQRIPQANKNYTHPKFNPP